MSLNIQNTLKLSKVNHLPMFLIQMVMLGAKQVLLITTTQVLQTGTYQHPAVMELGHQQRALLETQYATDPPQCFHKL